MNCYTCGTDGCLELGPIDGEMGTLIECLACKRYEWVDQDQGAAPYTDWKSAPFLTSHVIREFNDHHARPYLVRDRKDGKLPVGRVQRSTTDKQESLLRLIGSRVTVVGAQVRLDRDSDWPLIRAMGPLDYSGVAELLRQRGLVKGAGPVGDPMESCIVTADGWSEVDRLTNNPGVGNRAFVAMSFSEDLRSAWADGFEPALADCGYRPFRIDKVNVTGKVCDEILAAIRGSRILVADFTGQRAGVYFEAGFALGLGIPVIMTCKSNDVNDLHFDTRQYQHLIWDDPASLADALEARVRALYPL